MKLVVAILVVSFSTGLILCGCGGSPALTCQTQSCSSGTGSYQLCSHTDATVSYDFGGMSCSCASGSASQCQTCATEVASYCTGGGGGGGSTTCTATFSGGLSGVYSPCAVTVTYAAGSGTTSVGTAGNAVPGTPYTWAGFSIAIAGMPATGSTDQTATMGASDEVTQSGSSNPPLWEAGYGNGQVFGSAALDLTSLGPSTTVGNGNLLYQSPHGTFTATLVDQNPMTAMPNVMQTVTF